MNPLLLRIGDIGFHHRQITASISEVTCGMIDLHLPCIRVTVLFQPPSPQQWSYHGISHLFRSETLLAYTFSQWLEKTGGNHIEGGWQIVALSATLPMDDV